MQTRFPQAVLLAACLLPTAAFADEITDQIQSAVEAYEQKDYRSAVSDLNYAIAQIQELINTESARLLPEPLEGWTASEVESDSGMAMFGGGTSMTRTYQREAEQLEINIVANSPWVASVMQIMGNPMLMAGNPNLKPYRHGKYKGMKETGDGSVEVSLLVAGQVLVKLTGTGLGDEAVVEQYLDAMDFGQIQTVLLQ